MTKEQKLILDLVIKHSQLTEEQIRSASRKDEIVRVKHLLMYLYRECLGMSFSSIADITRIGNNHYNHTSVMHACNKARDRLFTRDTAFCYIYKNVIGELKEHGFVFEEKSCALIVRYPKGFPIHEVISVINQKYKELNYEFV